MAKRPRKWTGATLRSFRSDVAKLKAKGLVSPRVDARKQRATRYMVHKVKDLENALKGYVQPVKLPPKIARQYREAGFQVANNRVLMSPEVARRIRRSKAPPSTTGGYPSEVEYVGPKSGKTIIQKIYLPVSVRNWDNFLGRLKAGDFDHLKRHQDHFAFTFFGRMSRKSFKDSEALWDHLQHYQAVSDYPDLSWEHFILYKVYPPGTWEELGGGLTYALLRRWRGRRDSHGDRRGVGSRAKLSMDEIRKRDRERKAALKKTPETRAKKAEYQKGYRASIAKEQGRQIRPYKKRK